MTTAMTSLAGFDPLTYRSGAAAGVPVSADQRAAELGMLKQTAAQRTTAGSDEAVTLDKTGGASLWLGYAKEYRQHVGFLKGWAGTGLLAATMGVTAIGDEALKLKYGEARPFTQDPTLTTLGPVPRDLAFPSGHTALSYAAATVLGDLWPEQRATYMDAAREVGRARVYSGVHFPSDVAAGARLGSNVATRIMHPFSADAA